MEEDGDDGEDRAVKASIRSAKKAARPAKIGVAERRPTRSKDKKRSRNKVVSRAGGAFDKDFGQKSGRGEGVRAKKGDAIAGMTRKGGKRKVK